MNFDMCSVAGQMEIPCHNFRCEVHGNFLATKLMARYVEISMYLAAKFMARYLMYLATKHTKHIVKERKMDLKFEWKFPPTIFSHS